MHLEALRAALAGSKAVTSVLVIVLVVLVRLLVLRWVARQSEDASVRYRWRKGTLYAGVTLAATVLVALWMGELRALSTFFGLATAGLAIALKDLVSSIAGWLFILLRRPFDVGDRIEIGGSAGDVIDLRVFKFTLMEIGNWVGADQSTGRVVHIPNSLVLSEKVVNYSRGFLYIWNELQVTVTFESDWRRAKAILLRIAEERTAHFEAEAQDGVRRAADRFMIHYRRLTPIVYTSVVDSGVLLTVRHVCPPRARRSVSEEIWEAVLDAFAAESTIDFAYPTQRFFDNRGEGKPGAGGEGGGFP